MFLHEIVPHSISYEKACCLTLTCSRINIPCSIITLELRFFFEDTHYLQKKAVSLVQEWWTKKPFVALLSSNYKY